MALHVAQIDYEHREVLLRDKPQAMLDASPKGTVPVFVQSNGEVIDESLDLAHWALAQNDPRGWLNTDMDQAKAIITQNDGPFKHHLDRYKYKSRYDSSAKRGEVNLSHRAAALDILAELDEKLSDGGYLIGQRQTIADIATFPFIRQFAAVEPDWWAGHSLTHVRDWLARHLQSDLFKTIMTKHPLWAPTS